MKTVKSVSSNDYELTGQDIGQIQSITSEFKEINNMDCGCDEIPSCCDDVCGCDTD